MATRTYTVLNSHPSIEAFEKLYETIAKTFSIEKSIDEVFMYGSFFKYSTYVEYAKNFSSCLYDVEMPPQLVSNCNPYKDKVDFLSRLFDQIMKKEIEKPEWMKYIELNAVCDEYSQPPSSFLIIRAIDEKYEELAKSLVEFLYSPNYTMTMVEAE